MNTIEIEPDDNGFHAVIIGHGNTVLHVSNTFATSGEAERAALDWLSKRKDETMGLHAFNPDRRESNEDCPRFVAFVSDSYVEADDNLEALIALVQRDGLGTGEDCVVWDDFRHVAAVVLADGTVHRFAGRPESKPAPTNGRVRAKR